jgi:large subunit ribosomal protein L18
MESTVKNRVRKRINRALRVRKHVRGSAEKPRLSVMKSNQHIAVQLIDDEKGLTLAAASTMMKEFRAKKLGKSKEAAKLIGQKIAELAKDKSIEMVVFDRGHHKFHGVITELANAAREAGLKF